MEQKQPTQALRYNQGKPPLNYILTAPHAIAGLAKVFEHGAIKYAKHNWKNGLPCTEVADSLLRHLTAYMNGEDLDIGTEKEPGSGLPHVDQILWNALILAEQFRTQPGFDDRVNSIVKATRPDTRPMNVNPTQVSEEFS